MRGRRAMAGLASLVVAAGLLAAVGPVSAGADTPSQQFPPVDQPGVTSTQINVGGVVAKTNPLGGDYAAAFNGVQAYFNMVNASDRKSTRLNSSHSQISYAVFCLKKKKMRDTHGDVAISQIQTHGCPVRDVRQTVSRELV